MASFPGIGVQNMIRIGCPMCTTVYSLEDSFFGKSVVCQKCSHKFAIAKEHLLGPAAVQSENLEVELPAEPAPAALTAATPSERPGSPARRPRRGRSRQRSVLGPALAIGSTVVVVTAIVVACIIFMVRNLEEEPKKAAKEYPTGPIQPPPSPFGNIPDLGNRVADFVLNSLDVQSTGLTVLRPAGPSWPVAERPTAAPASTTAADILKRSAALIRVTTEEGTGNGSGFFCLEPGLMVTNAHVVGMMRPSDARPSGLEVVINSNEANERKLPASVLAVDRKNDLAILRVKGDNLPPPMQVISSTGLAETQEVFVGGFPMASTVGANMTVSRSNVSSLRKEGGLLTKVQVQKSMEPGNSGGPVVDSLGRVVGVSVAIVGDTDLNFAVPTDFIQNLYRGSIRAMLLYPASQSGQATILPATIHFEDSLSRIDEVVVECWTGKPGSPRAAAEGQAPEPVAGDSPAQSTKLNYSRARGQGTAEGELRLPPLPEGSTYWLRVVTTDGKDKRKRYFSAVPYQISQRLERAVATGKEGKPATPGKNELLYRSNWRLRSDRGEFPFSPIRLFMKEEWEEAGRGVTAFQVGMRHNNEPFTLIQLFQSAMMTRRAPGRGPAPPGGQSANASASGMHPADQFAHDLFRELLAKTRDESAARLPAGSLEPGKTRWTRAAKLQLPYGFGTADLTNIKLNCTYLGKQPFQGKQAAVVRMDSNIVQSQESPGFGLLWGIARVDLDTGDVLDCYSFADLEVERATVAIPGYPGLESSLLGSLEFRWRWKEPKKSSAKDEAN